MKRHILSAVLAVVAFSFAQAQESAHLRVSVLGDSYSTLEGHVQPSTNAVWYYQEGSAYERHDNDVKMVEQTWWNLIISDMGYQLERNNAYSGSTICYTGYKDKQGRHNDYSYFSFISRAGDLGHPDIILVCGGTNDSWCGAPVGDYKWKAWTKEDLYFFRPAMAKMCDELVTLYPKARVIFVLNSQLREDINDSVHEVCKHYNIECVDLVDIEKQAGHPSQKGMRAMADQVEAIIR